MAYIEKNPNPRGARVGDCVVRALSIASGKDWERVYIELAIHGFTMGDMPTSNAVWGSYLADSGYSRYAIPNTCPACYTVSDFCADNPHGTFILGTGSHAVAVIDGDYYDAWDSGDEVPIFFWRKEEK